MFFEVRQSMKRSLNPPFCMIEFVVLLRSFAFFAFVGFVALFMHFFMYPHLFKLSGENSRHLSV